MCTEVTFVQRMYESEGGSQRIFRESISSRAISKYKDLACSLIKLGERMATAV